MKPDWRIHTPNLLKEILTNPSCNILERPLQILAKQLYEVANRASQIDDPKLNQMMARLTLYEMADPKLEGHDSDLLNYVLSEKYLLDNEASYDNTN